jgi:hypothetical protein
MISGRNIEILSMTDSISSVIIFRRKTRATNLVHGAQRERYLCLHGGTSKTSRKIKEIGRPISTATEACWRYGRFELDLSRLGDDPQIVDRSRIESGIGIGSVSIDNGSIQLSIQGRCLVSIWNF